MQEYQSIKKVYAEPMDRLIAEKKGLIRDIKDEIEDGYIVVYADGYTSWSPKDVFEAGYRLLEKSASASDEFISEDETKFMQKREKIINIIDECKSELEKLKDEYYAAGLMINLAMKAQQGDIQSLIKMAVLSDFLKEK